MKKTAYLLSFYSILCPAHTDLQQYYDNADQLVAYGKQLSNQCKYDQAQPFFERACELEPLNLKRHLDLWKIYIQQEKLEKALAEKSRESKPLVEDQTDLRDSYEQNETEIEEIGKAAPIGTIVEIRP